MAVSDYEYEYPAKILVDENRTSQAVAAWLDEFKRRLRIDWENIAGDQPFQGMKANPNAAYITGLMQNCFLALAREPACEIRSVPMIKGDRPYVEGEIDVFEGGLGKEGLNALRTLELISDAVLTGETDCGWYSVSKMRFRLHGVWARYAFPGGGSEEWRKQLI